MTTPQISGGLQVSVSTDAVPAGELAPLQAAVQREVRTQCDTLGLTPVAVPALEQHTGLPLCRVSLRAAPLMLDARRQFRIAAAAAGTDLAAGGHRSIERFVLETARGRDPAGRRDLLVSVVHSNLVTNAAILAGADGAEVPWETVDVRRLAAALGFAPGRLRDVPPAPDGSDRLQVCEAALASLGPSEPPALLLNESTLRSLSSTPEAVTRWQAEPSRARGGLATLAGVCASLWRHYGIALPGLTLEIDDALPDDRYRFRFGETVTSPYLLLPRGVVAEAQPADLDSVVGWTVEPVGGEWYALLRATDSAPDGTRTRLDTIALLMRTLYAEVHTRLPRWADRANAYVGADAVVEPLAAEVRAALRPVVRWLLADGVATAHPWPLLEAVARVLARGEDSSAAMLDEARRRMGGAVFGHSPSAGRVTVLPLDHVAVSDAVAKRSAGPLVDAHPELTRSALTVVAVCPAPERTAVAELLRPLLGVVRVMTETELAGTEVNLPDAAVPVQPLARVRG